jgi:hypothetical protein
LAAFASLLTLKRQRGHQKPVLFTIVRNFSAFATSCLNTLPQSQSANPNLFIYLLHALTFYTTHCKMTGSVALPLSSEAAFAKELTEILQCQIITTIRSLKGEIPAFAEVANAGDLEGRCNRLQAHFKRLSQSSSVDLFQRDFDVFHILFQDLRRFLTSLRDNEISKATAPQRFWFTTRGGKYTKQWARLNNQLNDAIADHVLNVSVNIPEREVHEDKNWPPTIEHMQLSKPSNCTSVEEQQEALMLVARRSIEETDNGEEKKDDIDDNNAAKMMNASSTSILRCGVPNLLHWDFSPRQEKRQRGGGGLFGSSSNASKSRKDRTELYVKTQVLRDMPQDTPLKELRVVLSQLEPGDTSPGIMAGRAVMMSIGTLGALLVTPLIDLGGISAKEAMTQAPLEAAAVFSHYLIEFELEDGTLGTLENCVEDVYLYAGRSSRPQQHIVCRIPMTPGSMGSPDSVTEPLYLRDLIRFRNEERQLKYNLLTNNCKHFVLKALSSGRLFPKATNLDQESLDVFFAVCQGCYVQRDTFSLFHNYEHGVQGEESIADLFSDYSLKCISGLFMDDYSEREYSLKVIGNLFLDDQSERTYTML